jgi:RND superfamily putative drug exporter
MVLVPSIMTLLGKRAWWLPKWMEPIVPHLQMEEGGTPEPAPASATAAYRRGVEAGRTKEPDRNRRE